MRQMHHRHTREASTIRPVRALIPAHSLKQLKVHFSILRKALAVGNSSRVAFREMIWLVKVSVRFSNSLLQFPWRNALSCRLRLPFFVKFSANLEVMHKEERE